MSKPFYITTTLPYVNADPHVGFAMEIIRADVVARYKRTQGYDVFFNTGTDEHGAKIYEAAEKEGIDAQQYTDRFAARFQKLKELLNLSVDTFIRTTDPHHISAAQEFWKRCDAKGDIYKKLYKIKYCVGCELEKTDSELDENGHCPIHPNRELEIREEENYYFRLSKYQQQLLDFYRDHPDFVVPDFRFNEIKSFVSQGLEDFSISRLREKMSWGVPVPSDEDHVMYVWFDALVNYVSTLGWPENEEQFKKFWIEGTPVQYCGKDNNRQQTAMWQAMLMSAGLPNTKQVVINGFINSGGQKMSKSLGNVINPFEVVELFKSVTSFPEDALRFVLLHDVSSFEDGDLTMESIKASYTAHLANGLGNLTSRILTLSDKYLSGESIAPKEIKKDFCEHIARFDLQRSMQSIWHEIKELDKHIQETEPFSVIKTDEVKGRELIVGCVARLEMIGKMLQSFLPKTAEKILTLIKENKKPETPLFSRLL